MRSDSDLQAYLDAMVVGWDAIDLRTIFEVADLFRYDPLMAKPWIEGHLLPLIDACSRMEPRRVAELLHNPSVIRLILGFDLLMAKEAGLGVDVYMRIYDFYADALRAKCVSDPFTANGTNVIHTQREIENKMKTLKDGDRAAARTLGKLANACYSLSHGLYTDMNPQLVYDNFGPYYQSDNSLVVIKIFHNLRPLEIWPETEKIGVDGIDIVQQMEGVRMSMDATTHVIFEGSQVEGLRKWSCEADGKPLDLAEIDTLRKKIEEVAIVVFEKTKKFSIPERKKFYTYQKAWNYKKLCEEVGMDWKSSKEVLQAMEGNQLFDKWNIDLDTGKLRCSTIELFDPRKEIPEPALRR